MNDYLSIRKERLLNMTLWNLAQRTQAMDPGILKDILKLAETPGVISLAGGLPAAQTFPVEVMAKAIEKVLKTSGGAALQYSSGEGYLPLREWVANDLNKQGANVSPQQVIITTGSQQGLDLIAKVLIDKGSRILVETPTYLGALQAFLPMEPEVDSVKSDEFGALPENIKEKIGSGNQKARFMYVLPNFQNPTGRLMSEERKQAFAKVVQELQLPVLEDNPYGDLWFDAPPPPSLLSRLPEQCVYLGSFSKVLAPGLRLGFMVVPEAIFDKVLYVKMASDLHTPSLNQRLAYEVLQTGFLDQHVPTIRALYKSKRDTMLSALEREMTGLGVQWSKPAGGMFLWLTLPQHIDTLKMLPETVKRLAAYVPGIAFYANTVENNTLRLSFVTATPEQIDAAIKALADTIRAELS
ncbi:MAG: PLP-dependent aminotransferase family protein [Saezia sp.]